MFATFVALYAYYAIRADLTRVQQLLETVRATLHGTREWFRPFNDAGFGMLSWYRGEFSRALAKLESAAAARNEEGAVELEAVWFMPNEGTASIFTHLALAKCIRVISPAPRPSSPPRRNGAPRYRFRRGRSVVRTPTRWSS